MINKKFVNRCCDTPSEIENYQKAINDKTKTWDLHHKLEELGFSAKELIYLNLYYHVPADELVFLTRADHKKRHPVKKETIEKIIKTRTENGYDCSKDTERNLKISKKLKNVPKSERHKQNLSKSCIENKSHKGSKNGRYKWVCPLILAYRKNVLNETLEQVAKAVGFCNSRIRGKFKEYGIKIKRKSTKKESLI